MRFRRPVRVHAVVILLPSLLLAAPARGVAEYEASVEATLTLGDSRIIDFRDGFRDVTSEIETSGLPAFVSPDGRVELDAAERSVTVRASSLGVAPFVGGEDAADATGMARSAGTLSLFNPNDQFGILVSVTVNAFFTFHGEVDSDRGERAANAVSLGFVGNRLQGLPGDGLLYERRVSTRDTGLAGSFDFATSLQLLSIEREFAVLIPPSISRPSPGVEVRETYDLGLLAQAGGQATSLFNGPGGRALTFFPPGPTLVPPTDFIVPEPAGAAALCLLAGGCVLGRGHRRARRATGAGVR